MKMRKYEKGTKRESIRKKIEEQDNRFRQLLQEGNQQKLRKFVNQQIRDGIRRLRRHQLKLAKKIVPKWIKATTKDYLARSHYPLLSSLDEEHLGGKRWSDHILDGYFRKDWRQTSPARNLKDYFDKKGLPDNYWEITRSYLKRFFYVQDFKKRKDSQILYEYELMDDPKPKNYPTDEQKKKAFEKAVKTGKRGRIWNIIMEEEKEKTSEDIRWALVMLQKVPDLGFRYDVFLKPETLDFFKERGFRIDSLPLLNFLLSINTPNFFEWYHKERKDGTQFNLFDEHRFPEYCKLKKDLLERGLDRDMFDTAEYYFLRQNLIMFLRALTNFARPLFLIAHFLKKEHPDIYNYHLKTIKSYIERIQYRDEKRHYTPITGDLAGYMLWWSTYHLPLFTAVYEDYLFDGDRYLKIKLKKEGRPKDIVTKALVYIFVEELNKQKQLVRRSAYETTAELINSMFKLGHLFREKDESYHYPLSAESVKKIYERMKKGTKLRKKSKK